MSNNLIAQMLQEYYVQQLKQLTGAVQPNGLGAAQPAPPVVEQSSTAHLSKEQEMLLRLYDEFANTDDGKALAANLGKFARFVQSKVAANGQQKTP